MPHTSMVTVVTEPVDKHEEALANNALNEVISMVLDTIKTKTDYFDLTGHFPYRSAQGNQYILVTYRIDANAIYIKALKTKNRIQQLKLGLIQMKE